MDYIGNLIRESFKIFLENLTFERVMSCVRGKDQGAPTIMVSSVTGYPVGVGV